MDDTESQTPASARGSGGTSRWRVFQDRFARVVVIIGGFGIIASILGILLFIAGQTRQFLHDAELTVVGRYTLEADDVRALGVDEHRSHLVAVDGRGAIRAYALPERAEVGSPGEPADASLVRVLEQPTVPDGTELARVHHQPRGGFAGIETADGRFIDARYRFDVSFEGTGDALTRIVSPAITVGEAVQIDPERGESFGVTVAHTEPEGSVLFVGQRADHSLAVLSMSREEDFLGNVTTEVERSNVPFGESLTHLVLDRNLGNLFGATSGGDLIWWRIDGQVFTLADRQSLVGTGVETMELLLGEQSLVVADTAGALHVWFVIRQDDDSQVLAHAKTMEPHQRAAEHIIAGRRDRTFLAVDQGGELAMHFSTSEVCRWRGSSPLTSISAGAFAPKGDAAYLVSATGEAVELLVDNPHPEISAGTLFGKVWYEGFSEPAYRWQSTGGTEEEEPKLSLVPLLFGTLKGTLFALLIAIPLAVLGAVYTSQFLHPDLRRFVKPTVEVMASLPSVVLGFLAGLWLAPRVEGFFPGIVLSFVLVPLSLVFAGILWQRLPQERRARLRPGSEILFFMFVAALSGSVAFSLSDVVQHVFFAGDYRDWLTSTLDLTYDQRNAVVVGLAMGLAVIPIIYSIAEDSISNVPQTLISGSLALGASRWDTVVRVVMPTASPGIFSAVMIGFGRAIGETMIVLMGSGNTPVLDWNPFNGLRTLSANIAVEIPEAPQGGTLYRTLFLAALLLFVLTFVFNTIAEVVSQRLRKRYASL